MSHNCLSALTLFSVFMCAVHAFKCLYRFLGRRRLAMQGSEITHFAVQALFFIPSPLKLYLRMDGPLIEGGPELHLYERTCESSNLCVERGVSRQFARKERSKWKWASCHFAERHSVRWGMEGDRGLKWRKCSVIPALHTSHNMLLAVTCCSLLYIQL